MFIVGIIISIILHAIVPFPPHIHPKIYDYIITILITFMVWEGNLRIDTFLNKKFPWVKNPNKRILMQLPLSLIYSVLVIYFPSFIYDYFICQSGIVVKAELMGSSLIIGILITIILLSIEIGSQFFAQWKHSLIEVEKYRTESFQAQLQNLKNQINPHFLFNNLSVLSSLIYKDQDKAVDFINQLAKVYRYLLDNKNNELVTLENELKFIESYNYLLRIRFDKNIQFTLDIPAVNLQLLLPPMALQILVENAIKHNEVSADLPLNIYIKVHDKMLTVSNNLQLRNSVENSTKTGLQNIKARYHYFTQRPVVISENDNLFTVQLPLLDTQ